MFINSYTHTNQYINQCQIQTIPRYFITQFLRDTNEVPFFFGIEYIQCSKGFHNFQISITKNQNRIHATQLPQIYIFISTSYPILKDHMLGKLGNIVEVKSAKQ